MAVLVAGMVLLFRLRLGRGDLFPVYSTLRADPLGARGLHDGLAQVPGLRVERRLKPVKTLEATPPRTIVMAGLTMQEWRRFELEDFNALDAAVRAGSRLVITMRAHSADTIEEDEDAPVRPTAKKKAAGKKSGKNPEKKDEKGPGERDKEDDVRTKVMLADLRKLWGLSLKERTLFNDKEHGIAVRAGAGTLPEHVAWRSDLYFAPEQGVEWRSIYKRGGEAVLLERTLGRGSIVVAGDSFFLSNEALQRERPTALLTWMIGPNSRVVFDESHLGVAVQPGIAALARRYGLMEAFVTIMVLAALFIWQRSALFVPPAAETREVMLSYHPSAGLEALLRRAVPPNELAAACATEWKRTARPGDAARIEAVLAAAPKNSPAATVHNAAIRALRRH